MFPFKYKGVEYKKCTDQGWTDPSNNGVMFWCATEVDKKNEYISGSGKFGECDVICKQLGKLW